MKTVDKITLAVLALLFAGITAANAIQPNRPTESQVEQRPLAKMPEFSLSALMDGSYFAGWSSFVSDTFLGRDTLVDLSKEIDTLMGIPYDLGGEDQFAILQAGGQSQNTPDAEDEEKLADAFDRLNQERETQPADTTEPEGPETAGPETETDAESMETKPEDSTEPESVPETESESAAETEPDSETESAADTETEPETEPVQVVTGIVLSREKLRLTIGSGSVVYASVYTSDGQGAKVSWSISDKSIATIAANPGGGINVKGVAEGQCTLICRAGDQVRAECVVTVAPVTNVNQNTDDATADFITGGMFIYGDAVYTQAYYSSSSAKYYAQTAAYYQSLFGQEVQVSVVMAPVSSMVIDSSVLQGKVADQGDIQDKVATHMDPTVNFVDVYTEMFAHKDEYLYYKSDHHWTQRGAYYAYRAFAQSRGMTPTELDGFNYAVINESYSGSLYNMTKDSRIKNFRDLVETWEPKKELTMTVTNGKGYTATYRSSLSSFSTGYTTFIMGDNPYTVINVPENPQDKNILVLKDSFGNAFVPFLCEHYGNIIVVDVRYTDMNVYEELKDYGLTDIVFVNNVQAAMNTAWPKMYLNAVGVN